MNTRRIFVVATVIVIGAVANRAAATAPAGRYTITNGTVLDNKTHLTWQQTATTNVTLAAARTTCTNAGFRLPTLKEMSTIIDYQVPLGLDPANALIDQTAFPGTPNVFFWTATPVANFPTFSWTVGFFVRAVGVANLSLGDPATAAGMGVRCVR